MLASLIATGLASGFAYAGPEETTPEAAEPDQPEVERVDDRSEAKRAFDDGLEAVAAGKYGSAVESFERAYDLQPHPVTLFNLALALEKAGRRPEAWSLFEAVLEVVESDTERREVRQHLRTLEPEIAVVEIEASPRHRLCIDGLAMPQDEDGNYRWAVEPGTHELLLDEHQFSLALEPGDRRVMLLEGAERLIEGERRSPVVLGMLGLSIGTGAAAVGLGTAAALSQPPPTRTGLAIGAAGSAGVAVVAGVVALAIEVRERRRAKGEAGPERTAAMARCPGSPEASTRIDLELVPKVRRPAEFAQRTMPMPMPSVPVPRLASVPQLRGIRPPRGS